MGKKAIGISITYYMRKKNTRDRWKMYDRVNLNYVPKTKKEYADILDEETKKMTDFSTYYEYSWRSNLIY